MLRFPRSDTAADDVSTRIVDGPAAKAWLARMAQPATTENLDEIAQVLHALGAGGADQVAPTLEPERKFAIAERIRGLLLPLLSDRSREERFTVLPLDDDFSLHFWATVHAASALRDVYAWLVSQLPAAPTLPNTGDDAVDGGATSHQFVSQVGALQRALDVNAYIMLCVQRAHWAVPSTMWERHCVLGQLVRDLDCQDIEVADALRASATRTCRSAFVLPVLIALADPAARTGVEFEMVRMAAQRWSTRVGFRLERRNENGASHVRPVANPGPTVTLGGYQLRFDTQSALQSIDKRLEALADGLPPKEVGIGDSLKPQQAAELLTLLRLRWSAKAPAEIDSPDRVWRPASSTSPVQAVIGLAGGDASVPRDAPAVDPNAPQNPYAYHRMRPGAVTQPRAIIEIERTERLLENAESWTLVAESSDAVRCLRRYARPRIGLQRLVGLRMQGPDGPGPYLLGWVEALQASTTTLDDARLRPSVAHTVRVRLAPGVPEWLHATIDEVEVEQAFLLVPGNENALPSSAVRTPPSFVTMLTDPEFRPATIKEEGDGWDAVRAAPRLYGLVLPHASFRTSRLVRVSRQGVAATLRMEELMMRGSDFDLVRFSLL